jgi:hypothetical protein
LQGDFVITLSAETPTSKFTDIQGTMMDGVEQNPAR